MPDPRDHLALVLDLPDREAALALAARLQPWFGVVKVGLELFSAAGPTVVAPLRDLGYDVFIDLKLHDIPTTVGRAATVLGRLGASYLTLHTAGGDAMLRAGVDGFGAENASDRAVALGVTILTSDVDAPRDVFEHRVKLALATGCGGLVCAASDLADAKRLAPGLVAVVPGIRMPGSTPDDQARLATPSEALAAGADLLVIGRTVTAAADPAAAAEAMTAALVAARP